MFKEAATKHGKRFWQFLYKKNFHPRRKQKQMNQFVYQLEHDPHTQPLLCQSSTRICSQCLRNEQVMGRCSEGLSCRCMIVTAMNKNNKE